MPRNIIECARSHNISNVTDSVSHLDLFNPPNTELIIESKTLKIRAHQKPSSENPGTNQFADITNMVFITNRNSPNVTMVIGIVNMTSKGFINTLRTAKTPATTMAIKNPST